MQTTWKLDLLYKNDNDPKILQEKKYIKQAVRSFVDRWRTHKTWLDDVSQLVMALGEYERLHHRYGVTGAFGYYYWLRSETDQLNTELRAKFNKAIEFGQENISDLRFFELWLAKVDEKTQAKLLKAPELQKYRHFLEQLFVTAKYQLSEKEEDILSRLRQPASANWTRMTEEFLSGEEREITTEGGKKEKLSFDSLLSLIQSKNKKVRDEAAGYVNEILEKYAPVAEHEMNSILQEKKIVDELRGLEYPEQSRHLSDDIDTAVVYNMLSAVEEKFDVANRYYELKAMLLGVSKLAYHERGVEYGSIDKTFSYEDSAKLVEKVFGGLDADFVNIFKQLTDNGQVDVFPRKGKSGGAFCVADLPSLPTFVMLNHTNKLRDVTTLAHEMGHALNDELMKKQQHALYCGSTLAVAEVASTFMEDFVLEEIATGVDDEQRLAVLMMKLNDEISTIFRQVAAYRFEQELHITFRTKGYLSKEEIGAMFQKHMETYMGEFVEQPDSAKNWWIYWSHFRRFFYVYSYASGLLISKALQAKVRQDKTFIGKVKEFLGAGLSDSPKNIFQKLDIDITNKDFWQTGIAEVEQHLTEATELAKKLKKI